MICEDIICHKEGLLIKGIDKDGHSNGIDTVAGKKVQYQFHTNWQNAIQRLKCLKIQQIQ